MGCRPPQHPIKINVFYYCAKYNKYYREEYFIGYLQRNPTSINCRKKKNKRSPLHIATKNGNTKACDILIRAGIDINRVDKYGKTALHIAAKRGYFQICLLLLENGINMELRTNKDKTANDYAIKYHHDDIYQLFFERSGLSLTKFCRNK